MNLSINLRFLFESPSIVASNVERITNHAQKIHPWQHFNLQSKPYMTSSSLLFLRLIFLTDKKGDLYYIRISMYYIRISTYELIGDLYYIRIGTYELIF